MGIIPLRNFARALAAAMLIAFLVTGCAGSRKTGFDLQSEVWDYSDSAGKQIYITSTLPVDSADQSKLIFDIFRIETNEYPTNLQVYARVFDSAGHFITNMADPYRKDTSARYFSTVREKLGQTYNVREEKVPAFKVREFGAGDSIPYNIALTVDYSGSMAGVKEAIFEGTESFVSMKMSYDKIALSSFNKEFDLKVPLSKDKREIINLYKLKRENGFGLFSAVYDAVEKCINLFDGTSPDVPRVLVVFSDGDDNYSKSEIGSLIERAKAAKIHIFSVAFGYSKDENLRYMAQYTGGKFYKARTKEELIAVFRDIYMSLRYYYLITYDPPDFWGKHLMTATLSMPMRKDTLSASGEYMTGDLMPWDKIGKAFKRPILFDFNKADLQPESLPIIDEIVDAMMSNPKLKLEIQGHTDDVGGIDFNMKLSEARAKAVLDAIAKKGIDTRRLRSRGFGFSRPIAPNTSEQGRSENRRTEFVVLAK